MPTDEQEPIELPAELIDALRDESVPTITTKVDREIRRLSAAHFAQRAEPRRSKTPLWFAAAASVAVAVLMLPDLRDTGAPPQTVATLSDFDNSGSIDIADVLALARDNGNVSQEQLDRFAEQLVSLRNTGDAS